ncbi:uncharacterized protein PFL1_00482 [Pseudozyma flocculosa PF-1]|uniref:Uncharacterized protein n=1 Tax=Pseudozyma flocculosa TaxID=84751 RepID=A0A5C3EUJ4_9BASI|nr:uncharacterized protein PFL1_00482 [Pseudozyma flocculosa PF-1]EPQ32285.1 hypothetical protein PFL1_00482 [Pseudozyma flocculosa PF-1]SPO34759.1 uncharacterized protein PSFLO_00230 [Pseudozyma flocculosa]
MFSCVVAGRLPLTAPQQVDDTHAVFQLDDAQSINHITLFLTGQQPFPPGLSATVHFLWPGDNQQWIMLGCLRNTKPSAIFRLRGSAIPSSSTSGGASSLFSAPNAAASSNFAGAGASAGAQSVTATLGISIEPDDVVDAQMAALSAQQGQNQNGSHGSAAAGSSTALVPARSAPSADPNTAVDIALALAPKIAKNAFSYLSSFAPDSAPQTVPLLQKWLEQLERKLRSQGPDFLDKAE